MLAALLLSAGLLLSPQASAKEAFRWDFISQGLGDWQLTEAVQSGQFDEGLLVRVGAADTIMIRSLPNSVTLDGVTLDAQSEAPIPITLIWHRRGAAQNEYQQVPVSLGQAFDAAPVRIALSDLPGFDPNIDQIGFGLPAGTALNLQSLSLDRTSGSEKLGLWWQSFWTFDDLTMRSINFLWGPRLASSRASLETLYETEPAGGASANWLFYGITVIGLAWGGLTVHRGNRRRGLTIVLAFVAGSWVMYDLRMSAELLHHAFKEYQSWVTAPAENRTLRDSDDAFRVLSELPGALRGEQKYALLMTEGFSQHFFRYATYPALPVIDSEAQQDLTSWVVFHRPDITIENNRLMRNGQPVTGSGTVIERFSDASYLFRVHQ